MDPSVSISVYVLCALMIMEPVAALTYTCNPDNSIIVAGFTGSLSYYAVQGTTTCAVEDLSGGSINITGCSKDSAILVTYGSYTDMSTNGVQGGQTVNAFSVECTEISLSGVTQTIAGSFGATLSTDESNTVTPTYSVTSALNPTSANVGDEITWTITTPAAYTLEISSCKACSGSATCASEVSLISSGGCTESSELISNFTDDGAGSVVATIEAFKFHDSNTVYLECSLRVCPSNSTSCSTNCSVTTVSARRKREADSSIPLPANDQAYSEVVHSVLTVFDPNENSALTVAAFGWNLVMTLTFVLCYRLTNAF